MDKLIITATVDSTVSYPNNPHKIPMEEIDRVAEEYVRAVEAGASIAHIHGVRRLEDKIQPDGRKMSRLDVDGWRELKDKISASCEPIFQFGVAATRLEERIKVLPLKPDMMSVSFNAHDECFQPDPSIPSNDIYASHPRDELLEYMRVLREYGVVPEVECFHTGAYWNLEWVRSRESVPEPLWISLFLGWPGGTWTPPTPEALVFMVNNLPAGANWNLSVMNPDAQWKLLSLAISMGGHVRVGWEDNPYIRPGEFSEHNFELVEKVVRMAHDLGREVATPSEAREIMGLRPAVRI